MFKNLFGSSKPNNDNNDEKIEAIAQKHLKLYSYFTPEMKHDSYVFDAEDAYSDKDEDEREAIKSIEIERKMYTWIKEIINNGDEIDDIWDLRSQAEEIASDETNQWELQNSKAVYGHSVSGFAKEDDNNPFLAPVHGFSLHDYTAMCLKITSGVEPEDVCKVLGIETIIWEELNTIWPQRMAEDTTYTVTTLFGQYYAEPATHPKLESLQAETSEEGIANLEKLKTDRYYYEELCGARQAAYEYGLDGAQWILENHGINLADFQSVAMLYMNERNQNWNSEEISEFHNYQEEKQAEYAEKFAMEQGGNVADDIEF